MKAEDIKVKVNFTEGYQKRFTEACLKQLEKREKSLKEKARGTA